MLVLKTQQPIDISICPCTHFQWGAQQPPVSGSGRTYCSTISLRVTICRDVGAVINSQCAGTADGTTGAPGEKGPAESLGGDGGSSLAAGALKDHSRHNSVTYATKISSSLGFSQDEKAKLFFFRYHLFI